MNSMRRIVCFFLTTLFASHLFAQNTPLEIGQPAPEISLPQPDGIPFSLSSLQGKLVLIDFWATWCAPCVEEQPELKVLYDKYQKANPGKFEIVGVSLDKSKENWVKAIDRFKIDWMQVSDLMFWKSPVAKDYGIEELPFNVLMDEQGTIIAINLHGKELADFISNYVR